MSFDAFEHLDYKSEKPPSEKILVVAMFLCDPTWMNEQQQFLKDTKKKTYSTPMYILIF